MEKIKINHLKRVKFEYPNKSFNELPNISPLNQKGGNLEDLQGFEFTNCNVIMCNHGFDYQVDIYFEKEDKLYFMKLKMDLKEEAKLIEQLQKDENFKLIYFK